MKTDWKPEKYQDNAYVSVRKDPNTGTIFKLVVCNNNSVIDKYI